MNILSPMSPEAFARYLKDAVVSYAENNVSSRRWPLEGALERSKAAYAELLPKGLATPDNYLFEIKSPEPVSRTVGVLWFAAVTRNGLRAAFIYEISVDEEFRRQGHATRALKALEAKVSALGLTGIGLHVFNFNTEAQALYAKLGYDITGLNMLKHLTPDEA